MAPLKKYFLGQETPPNHRVTTCQKCIRTPDIEQRWARLPATAPTLRCWATFPSATTLSVEATAWAWEFLTKVLEIPADKLWISVYEEDDEAAQNLDREGRHPARAHRPLRQGGQLLGASAPAPAAPARRSTLTAAPSAAAASPDCKRRLRLRPLYGDLEPGLLPVRLGRQRPLHPHGNTRTSTPAWAWSAWPASCRASATSLRWTPCRTS